MLHKKESEQFVVTKAQLTPKVFIEMFDGGKRTVASITAVPST